MRFEISIRPRVSETDMLGHINNVAVVAWLEEGRSYMMREALGETPRRPLFVVARLEIDYKSQLFYGEEAQVHSGVERLGNTSMVIRQRVFQRGKLCIEGRCVIVHVGADSDRPAPLPETLRESLARFTDGWDDEPRHHPG